MHSGMDVRGLPETLAEGKRIYLEVYPRININTDSYVFVYDNEGGPEDGHIELWTLRRLQEDHILRTSEALPPVSSWVLRTTDTKGTWFLCRELGAMVAPRLRLTPETACELANQSACYRRGWVTYMAQRESQYRALGLGCWAPHSFPIATTERPTNLPGIVSRQ
jgi:hypothetical protein